MKDLERAVLASLLLLLAPGSGYSAGARDPGALCEHYLNKSLEPAPTEYDAPLVTFDETEGLYYVTSEFKINKREMLYICAVQSGQVLGAEVASSGSALRVTPELLHKWLGTQVENSRELGRTVREFKTGSDERATRLKSEMATWHTNVYVPATRNFGAAVATFNAAYQKVASAGRINSNDMARLHQTCQGLYDAVQTVLASGALASAPDQGTKQSLERFYAVVLDVHEACLENRTFALDGLLKQDIPSRYQALAQRFASFGLRP